jgi:adenosylcobinamide-phosphate guanylyltransferase
MAGGKGTRMTLAGEKPLIKFRGKPVIEHVLEVLNQVKSIDEVVVAVSEYTPKTAEHLSISSATVLRTPGKNYVSDMGYAIRTLKLQTVLTISCDMPLITSEIIEEVLEQYSSCGKPALMVAVPAATKQKLGMSLGYAFDFRGTLVVPTGINVNDGASIENPELDQAVYVIDKPEIAVNINTADELKTAETLFL